MIDTDLSISKYELQNENLSVSLLAFEQGVIGEEEHNDGLMDEWYGKFACGVVSSFTNAK